MGNPRLALAEFAENPAIADGGLRLRNVAQAKRHIRSYLGIPDDKVSVLKIEIPLMKPIIFSSAALIHGVRHENITPGLDDANHLPERLNRVESVIDAISCVNQVEVILGKHPQQVFGLAGYGTDRRRVVVSCQ